MLSGPQQVEPLTWSTDWAAAHRPDQLRPGQAKPGHARRQCQRFDFVCDSPVIVIVELLAAAFGRVKFKASHLANFMRFWPLSLGYTLAPGPEAVKSKLWQGEFLRI